MSDSSDDPTTNQANDPTVVTLSATATIEVDKAIVLTIQTITADLGTLLPIPLLNQYRRLNLTGVSIVDTITDSNNGALSLSSGPTLTAGDPDILAVGSNPYIPGYVCN